jgi:hypothetical protein
VLASGEQPPFHDGGGRFAPVLASGEQPPFHDF